MEWAFFWIRMYLAVFGMVNPVPQKSKPSARKLSDLPDISKKDPGAIRFDLSKYISCGNCGVYLGHRGFLACGMCGGVYAAH